MLTTQQKTALKTYIASVPALNNQPQGSDGAFAIAIVLNADASPIFWVWRTFVSDTELYEGTSLDATTWSWTIFIGRSQGERDAWRQMVNMKGGLNPSLANTQAAWADIFSGAGGANQRTHITSMGRRKASVVEQALKASGVGTTVSPAILGFEGPISYQDVQEARENG